ncbi:MAG TPA: tetratricopeptide repeat protein, partial [Cytophagaceae bacterium]|nr:tetratricopeptide repeat protein [Cytophagaceae bacterium]
MKKYFLLFFLVILTIQISYCQDPIDTYYQNGLTKIDRKDFNGAVEDFSKVIELKPDYASAYYNRG